MNYRPKTSQRSSTVDRSYKDIELLYQIMVLANELSKECFKKEDFRTFTKANKIFNNARDIIQNCDRVESS